MIQKILDDIRSERVKSVILDTDTYNEIDDQFALSYLMLDHGRTKLLSVNAAPFFNDNSSSPLDGMERSYNEILKIYKLIGDESIPCYRGSRGYLENENTAQPSDAADNIINTAKSMPEGERLYVVAIGAITNVASALIAMPEIKDKIVVVWLGGTALHIGSTHEFNMIQDIAAARVIFNCGAPLVMVPCAGMCTALTTTSPELNAWLKGKNRLCDYLCENVRACFGDDPFGRSRVIWDVAAATVLTNPSALSMVIMPTPVITYDGVYAQDYTRPPMIYVRELYRDSIFRALFTALTDK